MIVNRRRLPAPPPPPPRSHALRIRRDASLISLTSEDFVIRSRYRCCCRRLHLRYASLLIAALDMIAMTTAFGRGVQIGRSMQHNPMAISWFAVSSLIFLLGIFCSLSLVYAVFRERYLWMLPMMVLKAFTVLVCVATASTLVYLMIGHSKYLLDIVAEHVTKFDYEVARTAVRFGGGGLAIVFSLMALVHLWLLRVLYRCYEYLKDKYFWLMCRPEDRVRTVTVEFMPSPVDDEDEVPEDEEGGGGTRMPNGNNGRKYGRCLVNGGGPSASVSNSTALTEVEVGGSLLPHSNSMGPSPIGSAPVGGGHSEGFLEKHTVDSISTPILHESGGSDRERLWKAYEHTPV